MTERTATVVVASTRAANGDREDLSGPIIATWLAGRGFAVTGPIVVPDGADVGEAIRTAYRDGHDVILTTGGTGLAPSDRTPEETRGVLTFEIPGLADAIRSAGLPHVHSAALSRGLAGVAGTSLVVNLPGSIGGVRDGLSVLDGVLDHALDQINGGDHY